MIFAAVSEAHMKLVISILLITGTLAFGQAPGAKSGVSSSVPRGLDGKPDLNGVWQGGTNIRGNWEEANAGTGLGGTGVNPNAPVAPSSGDRQTREGAPYQPWAAEVVRKTRAAGRPNDPLSRCFPPGPVRLETFPLFRKNRPGTATRPRNGKATRWWCRPLDSATGYGWIPEAVH